VTVRGSSTMTRLWSRPQGQGHNPQGQGQGLTSLIQARCIDCSVIQKVASVDHPIRKKCLVISLVHRVFLNFKQ